MKDNKKRLFEMIDKLDKNVLNEIADGSQYHIPTQNEDKYGLVRRAVMGALLTPDEYFQDPNKFLLAAQETAENWDDMEEIGSSDMTFMLKEFLSNAGIETQFVNDRLTRM
jgi:hypothetical protein